MGENAERFLIAYNKIDHHLRKLAAVGRDVAFSEVLKRAAHKDSAVDRCKDDLREFADLRNALVHERTDSHPIAEPFEETTSSFEGLLRLLTEPPDALSLSSKVISLSPEQRIGAAAATMREHGFSQMPVYEGKQFKGLLTAATIAWWVASQLCDVAEELIVEEPVQEILRHTEDPEHHVAFLPRGATVFDAIAAFEHHQKKGWILDAVLITHSGKRDQAPIGILTVYDLPAMYDAVGG